MCPFEQTHETAQIVAQTRRRHGGVLGARPSARMARDERAGAESRLAQAPDRTLLDSVEERRDSGAGVYPPRLGRQPLGRRTRVIVGIGAKLDDQKRTTVRQQAHCVEPFGAREVGQMMVEALERLRAMLQNPRHLVGGEVDVVEAEHHQRKPARARHQPERRGERDRQCALRADQRAREVVAALRQKLVEVVAGDAAWNFRIAPPNLVRRALCKRARRGINLALASAARSGSQGLALPACSGREPGAVIERDFQRLDVVDGLAVSGGVSAARVVADHSADRTAVLGGGVGGEEQTLRRNRRVELRLHHTGFDHRNAALAIDAANRIHILGKVEHDGRVAGLAGERGAATARENRQAVLARQRERAHHVAFVARNHDA